MAGSDDRSIPATASKVGPSGVSALLHQQPMGPTEGEFFDSVIAVEGDFNPFADRGWNTLARCFTRLVNPRGSLCILDIGCGTGQSRQLYIAHAKLYAAIDLSHQALRAARSRFPESAWARADALCLPFADRCFDVVAFSSVLHHIPDYPGALREAFRVIRPGGWAFAFDPNLLHPAMALFRWPRSPFYSAKGVSPHESPLLPSRLRQAFGDAGFADIRQRCQSDIPYRSVAPKLLNACLGAYNFADWAFERIGLARWFGTFVITAGQRPLAPKPT